MDKTITAQDWRPSGKDIAYVVLSNGTLAGGDKAAARYRLTKGDVLTFSGTVSNQVSVQMETFGTTLVGSLYENPGQVRINLPVPQSTGGYGTSSITLDLLSPVIRDGEVVGATGVEASGSSPETGSTSRVQIGVQIARLY